MRLARLTLERKARCLAFRRRQGCVAQAAEASLSCNEAGARHGEVREHLPALVPHDGAHRHLEHEVLPARAIAPIAGAVRAARRLQVRAVLKVEQGVHLRGHLKDDVAAVPAVAAVGAAKGLELLAVDGRAAMAAVARLEVQGCAINKLGHGESRLSSGLAIRTMICKKRHRPERTSGADSPALTRWRLPQRRCLPRQRLLPRPAQGPRRQRPGRRPGRCSRCDACA